MPADRRTFADALESVIYVDATFAIAFLEQTDTYHAECQAFQQRLIVEGTVAAASELVHDEYAFHVLKATLVAEGKKRGMHWLDVKRTQPAIMTAVISSLETKMTQLDDFTISLPLTSTVRVRALQLMRDFALLPTDAYHIATALDAGVTCFATLDRDFLAVDGITVYTCLP